MQFCIELHQLFLGHWDVQHARQQIIRSTLWETRTPTALASAVCPSRGLSSSQVFSIPALAITDLSLVFRLQQRSMIFQLYFGKMLPFEENHFQKKYPRLNKQSGTFAVCGSKTISWVGDIAICCVVFSIQEPQYTLAAPEMYYSSMEA